MAKAKQERGKKSEGVRAYLKEHPKAPVREVVEQLKSQGIRVSSALVNSIKYTRKNPSRKKSKRDSKKLAVAASVAMGLSSDSISLATLMEAKKAADRIGGVGELLRAAEALAKLSQ